MAPSLPPIVTPLVLLLTVTLCYQAPAAAHSGQYEVGTVYRYDYSTSVLLNEPQPAPLSSAKDVGFRLRMGAELSTVWQHRTNPLEKIIQVTVLNPKLSVKARQGPTPDGFVEKYSKVEAFPATPVFAHLVSGKVARVFAAEGEDVSSVNMKKGLVSLLQLQHTTTHTQELDTSGHCDVSYISAGGSVTKTKTACVAPAQYAFYNHSNQVLGASVTSSTSVLYKLRPSDSVVLSAEALETHFTRVEARPASASEVIARQTLVFKDEVAASSSPIIGTTEAEILSQLSKRTGAKLIAQDLTTQEDVRECIACKSLKDLVFSFRQTLEASNLGTQSSALAYIRLLKKMRESTEEEINGVLKNRKLGKILPQFIDILAGTQTPAAHRAALGFLKFGDKKKITLPERYLVSVSMSTHPWEDQVSDFFNMVTKGLPNQHLRETLLYTVSALTRTLSRQVQDSPVVAKVTKFMEKKLPTCKSVDCSLQLITAINTLQQNSSVPLLLQVARSGSRKPAVAAMRALQTMPRQFFTEQTFNTLERIFCSLDRQQDSSVRLMAADLLLTLRPTEDFLRGLLWGLRDQESKEFNTVLLARLRDLLQKGDPKLVEVYHAALSSPLLRNYHVMGQNGLSTAFSRPLTPPSIPSSPDSINPSSSFANASFTNILEIDGGLLKRSTVDVSVDSGDHSLRLLSFGMYAGGLDMFGSSDAPASDETPEEANAGLQIALLDTQLRPLVFFSSTSEAMGHVWSGTASERTTALQGTALLQDHQQRVPLQNGFGVTLLLTGAVSYDFAGQIQISVMWSKEAHSLVEIGAGVVVQGQARVDASFVQTMLEHNTGVHARMDIQADVTMSGDIAMCMKMSQQPYTVVESVRKLERIPGSPYVLRKYRKRSQPGPGKTYLINQKSSELCNAML